MIALETSCKSVAGPVSSKIQPQYLDRWAIIYVRQSSPQQVLEHRESREVRKFRRSASLGGNCL